MFDRLADAVMPSTARYFRTEGYRAYGSWRFSDVRSAQLATSGRELIGGHSTRCSTPCRSL